MMNNAEMFLKTFGIYATELWATSESDFLKWLNAVWQKEKPMDDLIYRKDAIGVLSAQCYRGTDFEDVCGKDCECAEYMAMRDLPSAQKKGHWIDEETNYLCSECHRGCWVNSNYCPWCGADMREEEE